MVLATNQSVTEAARELGPVIREYAGETENNRRLSRPVVEALRDAGLFRMFTPHTLGGLELDPLTVARTIEEIGSYDSAAGWALMVGNSVDWWCARLPDEGAEELYADDPDAIIAAAFHPPQRAIPVEGGYRVSGRGPLASNIHEARWLFLTALVMDGDQPRMTGGAPEVIATIVRADEARIVDTWYALGMRGTDSNDVVVSDVFVPASRTYPLAPEYTPGSHYRGALYSLPAMGEVAVIGPPVPLAVARNAIDELRNLATSKTPFGSISTLRERTMTQFRVARAEAILRSARSLYYDTLTEAWERTLVGEPSSLEQKADLLLASAHAVRSAVEAIELIYSVAGTSAIYARSRLERYFRDIQVLRHHGFMSESRYETVGQVYLGVEPEFALVAF